MRKVLALTATLLFTSLAVTSCEPSTVPDPQTGSSPSELPASATQSVKASNTPSPSSNLPEVSGMTVKEARKVLKANDISASAELELPYGLSPLSVEVPHKISDQFEVRLARSDLSTDGSMSATLFAEPTDDVIDKYFSWTYTCGTRDFDSDIDDQTFISLDAIWNSKNFKDFDSCSAEFLGDKWTPTKVEASAEKLAQEHWEGREEPVLAFAAALEYCTVPGAPTRDDPNDGWGSNMAKTIIRGSVKLCPDAPFYDEMQSWAEGSRFTYGTYIVGEDIKPGTYKSSERISDCYWERMTSHGSRIANDFITHAAKGAIVSVRSGETFEAKEECGIWSLQ